MKILVADDDPVSRKVLQTFLQKKGYEVRLAADGAAALRALDQDPPDLLLLDIKMPLVSGCEVIRQVRSREGCDRDLPIVAVTAMAMKGDREDILKIGASAYLAKPYFLEEVLAAVQSFAKPLKEGSAP